MMKIDLWIGAVTLGLSVAVVALAVLGYIYCLAIYAYASWQNRGKPEYSTKSFPPYEDGQ